MVSDSNLDAANKYKEKIGKWYKAEGTKILFSEIPGVKQIMEAANSVGQHSNFALSLFQNEIEKNGDLHTAKVNFHELGPDYRSQIFLIDRYFWHLNIHFWTVFWWIEKSETENVLNPDLKKFWNVCRVDFERTLAAAKKESNKI